MVVDVHCHIGQWHRGRVSQHPFAFENGPYESYMSVRRLQQLPPFLVRKLLGVDLSAEPAAVDAGIEAFLLRHMRGAVGVDRIVLLAFDAYYDDQGRARGPARNRRASGTHLYVSNTYARDFCAHLPEKLWWGGSLHPYRADALAALDAVAAAGAVLIKWLPIVQNIDAADPRVDAFVRRCGQLGMPLLIHYGTEVTLPNARPEFEDPLPLLRLLHRLQGRVPLPPVIVAHVATSSRQWSMHYPPFEALRRAMTGPLREAPLYADISGMATPLRHRWLQRICRERLLLDRLVYGSDFPVPAFPILFRRMLGRDYRRVVSEPSWIQRDLALKRALGLPEAIFTRFGDMVAGRQRQVAVAN